MKTKSKQKVKGGEKKVNNDEEKHERKLNELFCKFGEFEFGLSSTEIEFAQLYGYCLDLLLRFNCIKPEAITATQTKENCLKVVGDLPSEIKEEIEKSRKKLYVKNKSEYLG